MGYRISIKDGVNSYYGTKHYGYYDYYKEHEFESYKYLLSIGKMDGDELFDYGYYGDIELTPEEFRIFIELYNKEYNEFRSVSHDMMEEPEIISLYNSDRNKQISWG